MKKFDRGISLSYLFQISDKYFKMSYPMSIKIINICTRDMIGIYYSTHMPGHAPLHISDRAHTLPGGALEGSQVPPTRVDMGGE